MKKRATIDALFRGQRFDERPTNSPKAASGILRKSLSEEILSQAATCGKKNFTTAVTTMGYIYLGLAIVLELCGTTCMKLSDGFEYKFFAAGTLIFFGVCFYFSALSMKTIPLNIVYATWSGFGIILAAAVSYFYFHENISTPGWIGIIFIVVGVVLCNFFGANH